MPSPSALSRIYSWVRTWFVSGYLLLSSCTHPVETALKSPPSRYINNSDSALHNMNGTWLYRGIRVNGYIVEKAGNRIVSKVPVIDGKENGIAYGWYPNGQKRYERGFYKGNREGYHKGWYANGVLSFRYFFHEDKYEGEQQTFFESGHRWQHLHYSAGFEEGRQKSWNDSGRVINNFTVKNGKLYGVIGRFDCMSVVNK